MSVQFNVIKYVPDTFRFEPKNVGVVVFLDANVLLRFYGETASGRVDGRRARGLKLDAENYGNWIAYFRRKATSGRWSDVREAMRRRPDFPFYVDEGGALPNSDTVPLMETLNSLYGELVEAEEQAQGPPAERTESFSTRVGRIIQVANLVVKRDFSVPALFAAGPTSNKDIRTEVTFTFGHENGHLHLMEPVAQPASAYGFFARAEAAHRADSQLRFLAFYRSEAFEGHEGDLEVIENYANTVDVDEDDVEIIASQVKQAVGGESLPK